MLPKLPPKCSIEVIGTYSIRECRRIEQQYSKSADGSFLVHFTQRNKQAILCAYTPKSKDSSR